jgi:cytochrome b
MATTNERADRPRGSNGLRVWDAPVRLFHWLVVVLVVVSVVTGKVGGNAMQVHEWSGIGILTLVLFRLVWGVVGSTYARFTNFVRGPVAALSYGIALVRGGAPFQAGHNPLGGWSILLMLASLGLQAATGLFANDDIMLEGPLAAHVSKETSDLLTRIHHANLNVLLALVAVHVAAALFYLLVKRENLIVPMFTGRKRVPEGAQAEDARGGALWLGAVVLAASAGVVWWVLRM